MSFQKGDILMPIGGGPAMHVEMVDDFNNIVVAWLDDEENLNADVYSAVCLQFHASDNGKRRRTALKTMMPIEIANALRRGSITIEDLARAFEDRDIELARD